MGLKIKFWANASVVDSPVSTETPKKKGRKTTKKVTKKATDAFVEVERDVTFFGVTPEFWLDEKNEDKVEEIIKSIPGVQYEWGYSQIRY